MLHYMPEIYYHDRTALLSVDFHPVVNNGRYRIVTSSMQKEVRLWDYRFEHDDVKQSEVLAVDFIANLTSHSSSVNVVRFSQDLEDTLLASADESGRVIIWNLSDQPVTTPPVEEDMPSNKENWVRFWTFSHEDEVTALCWSPDGRMLASVGRDGNLLIHNVTQKKRTVTVRNYRQFPNGITWDPRGKYIITMSTDRRLDLFDAVKGTRLASVFTAELSSIRGKTIETKPYKLFHDSQLASFHRDVAFTPCGELIVVPAAQIEAGTDEIFGTYVYKRANLDKEKPFCFLPSLKPTFCVKMCPKLFELLEFNENYSGLPYRAIWFILTKDEVIFCDSQRTFPFAYVNNIHYNNLTDASWSHDGTNIVISSLEGYNSFLRLTLDSWGTTVTRQLPECPTSPNLIKQRKKKVKKEEDVKVEVKVDEESPAKSENITANPKTPKNKAQLSSSKRTPSTNAPTTTPKSASLLQFLRPISNTMDKSMKLIEPKEKNDADTTPKRPQTLSANGDPPKRRIQFVTISD